MQPITLEVNKRDAKLNRGRLNSLRKEGSLPGVIYGQKVDPIPFLVSKKALLDIISQYGANALLEVKVEGATPIQAMIKDIQKHPVTGFYWHLDLGQISLTQKIRTTVPVVFEGEPQGVRQGGFIQYGTTSIEVECLPMELPQNITIDITELEIGDKVVVSDLKLSGDIVVLGEPEQVLVTIAPPAAEEVEEALDEAALEEGDAPEDQENHEEKE